MFGLTKDTEYKVDFSASQWDLYTSSMDCNEVANRLNIMLSALLNSDLTREEVEANMQCMMDRYDTYGAADSEPLRLLDRVLEEVYG